MNIEIKQLIYRFFEGNTSEIEEQKIKDWMESSEKNRRQFMQERILFDALLFSKGEDIILNRSVSQNNTTRFWKITTAAAIALLMIISTFFVVERYTNNVNTAENIINVPPGQYVGISLDDSTHVWLNGNTQFTFPAKFKRKSRTVILDGEAYFDVTTDKKRPFIVKTLYGDIKVTGTTFNVEAYSRYKSFETSLFEGGVELYQNDKQVATLKPNEKVTLKNNQLLVSKIEDTTPYQWRNGLIAFTDKTLAEIAQTLGKYFDIDIVILNETLPTTTYTGKFRQSDGIDYALRVLQKKINFQYQKDNDKNKIYIK